MNKPVLIIMAAGMGSRYGGLKQIDPVGSGGEIILDFSLYDAMMAGFDKAIFVIRKEHEKDFRALIDNRAGRFMKTEYAFQCLDDIPKGYKVPEGREKPWGTCHAVLAARRLTDGPFAVINADDYYGPDAFRKIYDFLCTAGDKEKYDYCMVGYRAQNTLTENGSVARGVCELSEQGTLCDITERTNIGWHDGQVAFSEDSGTTWETIAPETIVSMNFWGFTLSMMKEMEERFPAFLDKAIRKNPLKGEYFLPGVVDTLIKEGKAGVRVLTSEDRWYGVTYKEDKESVVAALQSMKDKGLYPDKLWK